MSYLYGKDGGGLTPPPFSDMLGQEVKEGDVVAYATTRANSAVLRIAEVREVKWVEKMDGGYYTWKVWATYESAWGSGPAVPANAVKLSEPSVSRMVRVAKGRNW